MARGRRTETGRLNITVRGGVDVSQQIYGDSKGSYFQGSIPDQDITVRVQGGVKHYWHLCLDNVATGRQYPFVFAYELLIGRTPLTNGGENKLVLSEDVSVSGNHCRILEMAGRLVIEDLGSRNHTFLNGYMIQQPTELPMWGQIKVGQTTLRVSQMEKK